LWSTAFSYRASILVTVGPWPGCGLFARAAAELGRSDPLPNALATAWLYVTEGTGEADRTLSDTHQLVITRLRRVLIIINTVRRNTGIRCGIINSVGHNLNVDHSRLRPRTRPLRPPASILNHRINHRTRRHHRTRLAQHCRLQRIPRPHPQLTNPQRFRARRDTGGKNSFSRLPITAMSAATSIVDA
jgi:hypothetical protein